MFKRALPACPVRRGRGARWLWHWRGWRRHCHVQRGVYLLSGVGKNPITLSLPGPTAGLLVDGTISGDYQVQGDRATFTVSGSSGTATLILGRLKKSLPMSQFGDVLASDAAAGVVCANNELTVTLQYIRLEFSKL